MKNFYTIPELKKMNSYRLFDLYFNYSQLRNRGERRWTTKSIRCAKNMSRILDKRFGDR